MFDFGWIIAGIIKGNIVNIMVQLYTTAHFPNPSYCGIYIYIYPFEYG